MIEKELRLGNFLHHKGEIFTVIAIDTDGWIQLDNYQLNTQLSECSPIELTEDILLKCGFEIDHSQQIPFIYNQNFEFYGHDGLGFGLCLNNKYNIDILYIHHLQNIYYALTGKELQIDLK